MKVFQKITCLVLATVFLLSSLGFTINKMICLKSGKEKLSFVAIEDCCAKKNVIIKKDDCCDEENETTTHNNQAFIKKIDCCNILNSNFDLSDFQSSKNYESPQAVSCVLIYNHWNNIKKEEVSLFYNSSFSLPPNLYGRQLLSHISVLTI